LTYQQRIDALRARKMEQTQEKWVVIGSMDHDDWALVLPPEEYREVVQTISGSGMPITDVLIKGLRITPNHPNGGFYGPKACGENFGSLLRSHPTYIDPLSSLAGAYMVNCADIHETTFHGVNFEVASAGAPSSGVVSLTGYGAGMYGCTVFGQNKTTIAVVTASAYSPYAIVGLQCANFAAGSTGISGTSSQVFGAESTISQSFTGTLVGCKGSFRHVVNNTQPTLTYNGEIVTWEDSDGGPLRYIVARVNGVDYKVAVA